MKNTRINYFALILWKNINLFEEEASASIHKQSQE